MYNSIKFQTLLLIAISFLVALYVQWPILKDYYAYDGDSSPIFYWFNSIGLNKTDINPNDLMSQYASWFVSLGLKVIYLLGSFFFDPIILVKFIPLLTSVLCVFFMYCIVKTINGHNSGLIAGVSFICVSWFYRYRQMFGSADAEEFSIVLMLIFIYFLLKCRYRIISFILLLQTLFYPPLFFLCGLTIFGIIILNLRRNQMQYLQTNKIAIICLSLTILTATAFLYFKYILNESEFLGRPLLPSEVKVIGDFNPGGRNAALSEPDTLLSRLLSDVTGIGLDLPKVFMMTFIAISIFLSFKFKIHRLILIKIPQPLWVFLLSGIVLTLIANLVMFRLYEPSRYIQNPLNIFLIIFVSINLFELFNFLFLKRKRLLGNLFIFSYLTLFMISTVPNFGCHKEDVDEIKPVIKFLSLLPSDIFIAGHPMIMNGIGIYSKKRVFLTYKISTEVYWHSYYQEMTKRTKYFFDAYYAQDEKEILNLCQRYGITHIVVDLNHFSAEYLKKENFYFRPFNDYIKKITNNKSNFFFRRIPEEYVIFKNSNIYVIDCSKLLKTSVHQDTKL